MKMLQKQMLEQMDQIKKLPKKKPQKRKLKRKPLMRWAKKLKLVASSYFKNT